MLGVCNGVNVLAWARVGGKSPVVGKIVVMPDGPMPGLTLDGRHYGDLPMRYHMEQNGAKIVAPRAASDPGTDADDVYADGLVLTAMNNFSAAAAGRLLASLLTP